MHFKSLIVIIEVLFMAFMTDFEVFEAGFDDKVEGTDSINGANILKTLTDFPACLIDITRSSVVNSDDRIHLLR